MRVPSFEQFKHWTQGTGLFIAGMIVGAAIFMSIYQHNMEIVIRENYSLRQEIVNLKEDNNENMKYKNMQNRIRTIDVRIDESMNKEPLDELIKNNIKARVRNDLSVLKGQPISRIFPDADNAPQMVKNFYKKVLFDINEKDYAVEIQTMVVLYGELRVWVSAKEYVPD